MKQVVIIGGNHHNTLGVVRSIGQADKNICLKLILVSKDKTFVQYSKYVSKGSYRVIREVGEIRAALESFGEFVEKPVIISSSDNVTDYIDKNYNILSEKYILPNCHDREGEMTQLMDKDNQARIANSLGIETPHSISINKNNFHSTTWDEYPCILKPLESVQGGKTDIAVCNDSVSLENALNHAGCANVQIQRYIDKEFEFQLIGCSLKGGEQVILPGFTKLIRQPETTNTGYLRYSHKSQLVFDFNKAISLIKKIGYSGLFSMEFLRGKDGKDYFMEINMRNDGNAYCVTEYGVNLPYIWYQFLSGIPIQVPTISVDHSILFIPEFADIYNVKSVGVLRWLKEVFSADCHAVFKLNDLKPFIVCFYQFVLDKYKRITHSKYTTII